MSITFTCLYCAHEFLSEQSTLEHAIPKFLGGAHAPAQYKLKNVCRRCNNDLGSFVDASYAKSWFVTNSLAIAAHKLYDGTNEVPLPLTCIGPISIPDIQMPSGYLSEFWIGPSGETFVWLRPDDEEFYWFVGGNPRHRSKESTVYWFPASDDMTRINIGLQSLNAAFKNRKNARRVAGVACSGWPGNGYPAGFSIPSSIDEANIAVIRKNFSELSSRVSFNLKFDQRFICKMALGVGYGLFGELFLHTDGTVELRRGCWPKNEQDIAVRGTPTFGAADPIINRFAGYPGAIVLTILPAGRDYALMLTIDGGTPFCVCR